MCKLNSFISNTPKFRYFSARIVAVTLCLLISFATSAQNYGLGFFGHDKLKDERTELNLTPEKAFKFSNNFSVSFDLKFHSSHVDRYGYVVRIIKNDTENIDLVYNMNRENGLWYFYLIAGRHTAEHPFTIDRGLLQERWVPFELKFDTNKNANVLLAGDSLSSNISLPFEEKDTYRIMFGACDFETFKTRDVPVINLKDVKILEEDKLKYHWPLNQVQGTSSKDVLRGKVALIRNPDWLRPKHEDWVEVLDTKQNGIGQVAVNYAEEIIYLIGKDQIIAFSTTDNSYEVITVDESPELLSGCQAVFNPLDNKIYSYVVDDQSYSSFDIETRKWEIVAPENTAKTVFLHHNKYFSTADSSLYLFGGYGQHEYKNSVQQISFNRDAWELLETEGKETYEPRYLAASGVMGDNVYILGGYGSLSGDQMLNPQHYTNMIAFSLKDQSISKVATLDFPLQDICFSNSLVINEQSGDFLALAFPRLSDEGFLQLVQGSLGSSKLVLMGKRLPYLFHDTKSYSDLFYFSGSNKLVAYTSFVEDEQQTIVQLHTLLYPPNVTQLETEADTEPINLFFVFLIAGVLVLGGIVGIIFYRKKKGSKKSPLAELEPKVSVSSGQQVESDASSPVAINSKLLFFGGFQIYDAGGNDITGKFTPLLKELFLLIWLHTAKNQKGIASERMTEILWFDKSASSARNNKAVNIAKLRTILSEIGNCEITSKTGYWKVVCDHDKVYNDYLEFLDLTQTNVGLTKHKIVQLISIIEKGAFLFNLNYEWLDDFKAAVSERIIETLYTYAETLDIKEEATLIVQISDCIFSCDSINEEAMVLKCKAHFEMGAHSLSKTTYNKFCKDYLDLYGQDYDKSFTDVTNRPLQELIHN